MGIVGEFLWLRVCSMQHMEQPLFSDVKNPISGCRKAKEAFLDMVAIGSRTLDTVGECQVL
jgi:hypothetical protein